MGSTKYSLEYFYKETRDFREIMCSSAYTKEQKQRAFSGVFYCYLNLETLNDEDEQKAQIAFESLAMEWGHRKLYEPKPKLTEV